MNINMCKEFPDLLFWVVGSKSQRRDGFPHVANLFCTLERSLSLKSCSEVQNIVSIDQVIDFHLFKHIFYMCGVVFAETGNRYFPKDIDQLKEDCLIAKLSGLTQ